MNIIKYCKREFDFELSNVAVARYSKHS